MSKKSTLILLIIVLMLSIAGVGYYLYSTKDKTDSIEESYKTPLYYKFDKPFVVSFKDSDGIHYLKVGVSIKTYSQNVKDLIKGILPSLESAAVNYLSGLSASDIYNGDRLRPEFKEELKEKLLEDFNFYINENKNKEVKNFGTIDEVLINELVIQ